MKVEAVKALQRELRNLTLNYLEWQINEVAIRVEGDEHSRAMTSQLHILCI